MYEVVVYGLHRCTSANGVPRNILRIIQNVIPATRK